MSGGRRRPWLEPAAGRWEHRLGRLVLALGDARRDTRGRIHARGTLWVVQQAERLAARGHDKRLLRPGGILRYEIGPYPGRPLPLPGQPPVLRGETVVILHWDNRNVGALGRSLGERQRMTFQGSLAVREELRALAQLAAAGDLPAGVRAVWTETVIYPMMARYWFQIRPAPRSLRTALVRIYLLGLLALYSPEGPARVRGRTEHIRLGEAWIDLDTLLKRFARRER